MEGVMMRGVSAWAVAMRRDDGEIDVESFPLTSFARRHRWAQLPVVRGVAALAESLALGFRALRISLDKAQPADPVPRSMWAAAVAGGLALATGLFFVVPVALTSLLALESATLFWLVEGALRTTIFIAYLALLARMPDLRRLFEYHGAEHKVISCYEAGEPPTPAAAQRFPRLHPRCGTTFLLVVMVVAILVFAPLGLLPWPLLIASRVVGIPLIAGIAFEVIKWAGRNRGRRSVRLVMWPGMQLQRLTTREPDLAQLAVAVTALEAAEGLVGLEVAA